MWHAGCFSASGIECCESSGKWILFRTRRSASQGHSVSAATLCSVSLTAQHRMKERRSHEAHFLLAGFVPSERCACTGMPVSQPCNAGRACSSSYFPQDCYVLPIFFLFCCRSVAKLCPPLLWPQDCSPPGSSVHGVLRVRTLEWDAVSFSRGSSRPRDWAHVSCTGRRILYHWAAWEVLLDFTNTQMLSNNCD